MSKTLDQLREDYIHARSVADELQLAYDRAHNALLDGKDRLDRAAKAYLNRIAEVI